MASTSRIRIVVLHGDPVAQAGLSVAFCRCADFEVQSTPEWAHGQPLPGIWRGQSCTDVVVADYHLGVALAAEVARQGRVGASPRVVVVAGFDREWEIRSALEQGVRGYILVGSSLDELADGVRAVHRGARHLSSQVAGRLAESLALEPLTAREEEVLELVVQGMCNKAIGRLLGIAVGTVKSHLKSAFDKLNVESRTQAVATVQRRGLLRGSMAAGAAMESRMAAVRSATRPSIGRRAEGQVASSSFA